MKKKKRNIAILHDYFDKRGGGERLVLIMAEHLKADLITGFTTRETFTLKKYKVKRLGKPVKNPLLRTLTLYKRFVEADLGAYDLIIMSGTSAIMAAKNKSPNLWYCHTPNRALYSQYNWYMKTLAAFPKIAMQVVTPLLRLIDQFAVRHVDYIATNSKNVRGRVLKFYGKSWAKKTRVIYPPTDLELFRSGKSKDYYFSWGRVDSLKRTLLLIEAFQGMPEKKLIVASGGPDLKKAKEMAKGYKNIEVLGFVDEKKLQGLVAGARATLYIPIDEDFGMTPLESMAAGKPCIGVNEGGLKETIIHKKTGFLCKKNPQKTDIQEAVKWMTAKRAKNMKKECIVRSREFSKATFLREIDAYIKDCLQGK